MGDPTDIYLATVTIGFVACLWLYGVYMLYTRVCGPRVQERIQYDEIV
jgi:hypothetical protein